MNIDKYLKNIDLNDDEYVIVGVSSGPDSMALLNMLKTNLKCKLVCAHINHNIRIQSNEEEEYLRKYCKKENIIFETMKIHSYNQRNFENEAREKRYNFYEQLLNKYNSHNLFLAHHGDDLIETIIMKIIRGSNLEGYAGIKTISKQKDYKIIRPLLNLTKKDILKYNEDNNIKYYIDNTNEDIKYTRNRYRKKILPLLKEEDQNVHLKFLKYSNTLQEYDDYIKYEVKSKINKIYINDKININELNKEHPFIIKNIIFYILSQTYNNKANIIKEKNINDIINMLNNQKPNYTIDLPNQYIAKKEYNYISIEKKKNKEKKQYKIKLQDYNEIENIIIILKDNVETDGNDVCRLNSNNIKLPLYIRNKKEGDYIELKGTNGRKKIKDIFIDSKIPKDKRDNYPLLVDSNDTILWIPNIKKSKYNAKKEEFYDIILTGSKKERI